MTVYNLLLLHLISSLFPTTCSIPHLCPPGRASSSFAGNHLRSSLHLKSTVSTNRPFDSSAPTMACGCSGRAASPAAQAREVSNGFGRMAAYARTGGRRGFYSPHVRGGGGSGGMCVRAPTTREAARLRRATALTIQGAARLWGATAPTTLGAVRLTAPIPPTGMRLRGKGGLISLS